MMKGLLFIVLLFVVPPALGKKECDGKGDVLFVLDSSTSVGPVGWRKVRRFVADTVAPFRIDPKHVRVAVMSFNTKPRLQFKFTDHTEKRDLLTAIRTMKFSEGVTFMGEAFRFARKHFKGAFRPGVPKLMIVISDGKSNGYLSPKIEGMKLKKLGIRIIAIATSKDINKRTLTQMSSKHKVYSINSTDEFNRIFRDVEMDACKILNTVKPCTGLPLDLAFVLDSSTSVGDKNWEKAKRFLIDLIKPFKISKTQTRVALITYNTKAKVLFNIDQCNSYQEVKNAIMSAKFSEGTTFTGRALTLLMTKVAPKMNRKNINRVIVLVTDGKSNGFISPVGVAKMLKKKGFYIITVGISDEINKKELKKIASGKVTYHVKNFDRLRDIVQSLRKKECKISTKKPKPVKKPPKAKVPKRSLPCKVNTVDMLFVLDSSSSVGPKNWKRELNFLTMLTKPFNMQRGEARVALITFNNRIRVVFGFNKYKTNSEVEEALKKVKFTEGVTFTGTALTIALKSIAPTFRRNVKKLLFLVTDGKSNGPVKPITVAKKLKRMGVTIFSIGITEKVNKKELKAISSNGCTYRVDTQKQLNSLLPAIDNSLCKSPKKTPKKGVVKCRSTPVDLIFVLDSSTSVGKKNWKIEKNFLVQLIKPFKIGRLQSRVALVTFNNKVDLVFNVNQHYSYKSVKAAILRTRFSEGTTFTGKALSVVLRRIVPTLGRPRIPKILVLITDGRSNDVDYNSVKVAAQLKKKGIVIFTVGITEQININELKKIASNRIVYYAMNFDHLSRLTKKIQKRECAVVNGK